MASRWIKCGWLLVIGAIINVAVAWGCSLSADPNAPLKLESSVQVQTALLIKSTRSSFGCDTTVFERTRNSNPERASSSRMPVGFVVERKRWTVEQSGWPMRSLAGGRRVGDAQAEETVPPTGSGTPAGASPPLTESRSRFSVPVRPAQAATSDPWTFRMLPMKPLWLGFTSNSLMYSAAVWMLLAAPKAVSRKRRKKRSLCPICAYPVGESSVCTECGASVQPAKPSTE